MAGAICSATASNLAGIVLTPLIFSVIAHFHGIRVAVEDIGQVFLELLVPFVIGHLLRPWIGQWAERNRRLLNGGLQSSI